jgi:hypothetical protein
MTAAACLSPALVEHFRAWAIRSSHSFFLICAAFIVLSSAAAEEKVPNFPKNITYDQARSSLYSLGWSPVKQDNQYCDLSGCYARCARGLDGRCEAYPEAETCHKLGLASCEMIWRRGGSLIEVRTFSADIPPYVDRVQCRAGC